MAYDPTAANQQDFFGETAQGGFDQGIEGSAALTPEGIAEARARKKQWLQNQGLDENGDQLPAYGTSAGNGGTATGFAVMPDHSGSHVVSTSQLGSNDELVPGAAVDTRVVNTQGAAGAASPTQVAGTVSPGDTGLEQAIGQSHGTVDSAGNLTPSGTVLGGAGSIGNGGGALLDQTVGATKDLRAGLAAGAQGAQDTMSSAIAGAGNMNPLVNRSLTQTAANQAGAALGPATSVQQSLADRGLADYNSAQGASRAVLDQLMNGPSTAARIGSQTLRNQLALARSAGGGAGAVQSALTQAQAQAPELQAQAAQSAVQENLAKTQAAAGVAQGMGQSALGARGQDIDVAKSNQASGMRLSDNIAQLTGQQLQLNQQSQELLGRMATDMSKQSFDWSALSAQQQQAELDRWIKVYGIDQDVAAKIKIAASAGGDKGVLDYIIPLVGTAAQLGTML